MRTRILEVLRRKAPEAVSGEEISNSLGVSRTAIWKHIQVLKNNGYLIESLPKKGYILRSSPDSIRPEEILTRLKTKWLGREIHYEDSVVSTNEVAKKLANAGCNDGLLCVAEEQVGGKGRLARGWFSPYAQGLWFSIVLKPPFLPEEAAKCTLLAAVAVVRAVHEYTGVDAGIKWPNDILFGGKKLVGILTEMNAEFGHINYVVIGIGINIKIKTVDLPPELQDIVASLAAIAQQDIKRAELLALILQNMEELYEMVLKEGFAPVFAQWRKWSVTLGKDVKVIAPAETYEGRAVDIDEEGLLIVRRSDGNLVKVIAGDVSIRATDAKGGKY
ncbi:MAG TPA: biotin--[acetyl-CoA-carboxylase] ligase [Candidatus Avacidaminococcus intestinavium]|uniref:Bifunctional ligase/repressor BirA n=1 Tax=Candidatus Avacidaminococcus intestinavium TaxID=2840684 RepID=A0A9D1MNY9_9FIRM|nr:biotin--[acetyl-CoA-carboxylase] ligase [Candidatus Avacidaminococcus intestinavium]